FAEIGDGKGDKFTHGVLPSQAAGGAAGHRAADRIVLQKHRSPAPPGGAEGYTQSIIPCPQANGKCGGPPCRPKPTKYARPAGGGQPDGRKRMRWNYVSAGRGASAAGALGLVVGAVALQVG